jgi:excinuclease ABC subunit C
VAVKVLKEKGLNIPVIGLAKRIEEIFLPDKSAPIVLPHDNPVLQLLQRLRDEAHRFGITFHRTLRSKAAIKSALDEIPGIGPKTKKLLKQKIGTIAQIRQAPIDELEQLVGKQKAEQIKKHL